MVKYGMRYNTKVCARALLGLWNGAARVLRSGQRTCARPALESRRAQCKRHKASRRQYRRSRRGEAGATGDFCPVLVRYQSEKRNPPHAPILPGHFRHKSSVGKTMLPSARLLFSRISEPQIPDSGQDEARRAGPGRLKQAVSSGSVVNTCATRAAGPEPEPFALQPRRSVSIPRSTQQISPHSLSRSSHTSRSQNNLAITRNITHSALFIPSPKVQEPSYRLFVPHPTGVATPYEM